MWSTSETYVVLVSVNKLQIFTSVEDNGMVLVVRFAVTENRVAWQLDSEFRLALVVLSYVEECQRQ